MVGAGAEGTILSKACSTREYLAIFLGVDDGDKACVAYALAPVQPLVDHRTNHRLPTSHTSSSSTRTALQAQMHANRSLHGMRRSKAAHHNRTTVLRQFHAAICDPRSIQTKTFFAIEILELFSPNSVRFGLELTFHGI
jgi:hypothetical protein